MERQPVDLDVLADHVPGRARDLGDDGGIAPGEAIEQAGFAYVRAPGDDHGRPLLEQNALPGRRVRVRHRRQQLLQTLVDMRLGQVVHLLLGKIDGRLHVGAQRHESLDQRRHFLREAPLHRALGAARSGGGGAVDEVRDGFRLRQVHLVVEKSALQELPGARGARAQRQEPPEHQIEHDRSPVSVQLEHVLAGQRAGTREEQRDAPVQGLARGVAKGAVVGHAGLGDAPQHGTGHTAHGGTRGANDADPAASRRSGDGGDGVLRPVRGAGAAYIVWGAMRRVMTHCWTMDRTLFTSQ